MLLTCVENKNSKFTMEPIADFIVEISDQLDLPDNGYKTI